MSILIRIGYLPFVPFIYTEDIKKGHMSAFFSIKYNYDAIISLKALFA